MVKTQQEIEDAEIKRTLLTLAKEHKKRCKGDCAISLQTIRVVLGRLAIPLTDEDSEILF